MFRMKGITPIISIIVLLLIMVALAGAAWTYISGFMGAYTTKVVDIPPGSSYFDGRNVKIMLRNIGTSAINTGPCSVSGQNSNTVTCGDITITREGSAYDVDIRPSAASISPKGSITITDYACESGNVKYIISSPTSTYEVYVDADKPCSYPTDPVSWWKFDGNAQDSVGGNHGTPNGGVNLNYDDSVRGKAASFDGVDDYVDVGTGTSLNIISAITIEAWIYPKTTSIGTIVAKNGPYYLGYGNSQTGASQRVGGGIYVGEAWTWISGNTVIPLNTWSHIAVRYDGSTEKVYLNGNEDGSTPKTGTITISGDTVKIGYGTPGFAQYFNGLIDDVMIFKRALSPEEIKAVYNSQKK